MLCSQVQLYGFHWSVVLDFIEKGDVQLSRLLLCYSYLPIIDFTMASRIGRQSISYEGSRKEEERVSMGMTGKEQTLPLHRPLLRMKTSATKILTAGTFH